MRSYRALFSWCGVVQLWLAFWRATNLSWEECTGPLEHGAHRSRAEFAQEKSLLLSENYTPGREGTACWGKAIVLALGRNCPLESSVHRERIFDFLPFYGWWMVQLSSWRDQLFVELEEHGCRKSRTRDLTLSRGLMLMVIWVRISHFKRILLSIKQHWIEVLLNLQLRKQ